jgi:hypothetical protein
MGHQEDHVGALPLLGREANWRQHRPTVAVPRLPRLNRYQVRGIVDILGISRDSRPAPGVLRRGDLFEIVLIRVKGESALGRHQQT